MINLEAVKRASKFFHDAGVIDISILVTDAVAKVIEFFPNAQVKTNVQVGDVMSAGPVKQCITEGRSTVSFLNMSMVRESRGPTYLLSRKTDKFRVRWVHQQ